jgi:hypothetical protein
MKGSERNEFPLRQGELGFGTNDAAVGRPPQERRTDERIENSLTRMTFEAEQSRGLGRGQPQTRHFVELGTYSLKQCCVIHAPFKCKG